MRLLERRAHARSDCAVVRLQLRDNLHWCNCQGRAVFLDTLADRYFCLPRAANDAFLRLAASDIQAGDAGPLNVLLARGLLIEGTAPARIPPPPSIETPTCDYLEEPVPRAGLRASVRALASELQAVRMLRTRSFHKVIGTVQNRCRCEVRATHAAHRTIREIVAAAATVSFITRSHDRCLVRALAVHSMCTSSGIRPQLIFGVVAHPFTAHCWVQLGSAVLVGGYEQARLYTPILVLE